MIPETHYAWSGDISIAYQVIGEGPIDLVVAPGWVSNIDLFWEEPSFVQFFQSLAEFSMLMILLSGLLFKELLSYKLAPADIPIAEKLLNENG
jgi:hypothetical protein